MSIFNIFGESKSNRCYNRVKLARFSGLIIPIILFSGACNADLFTVKVSPYCSNTQTIGAGNGVPLNVNQMVNVLDEEFNGTKLNKDIWRIAEDSAGDVNNTLQANTPNNYSVENGVLTLIGKKQYYIQPQGYKGAGLSKQPNQDANGVPLDPNSLTLRPYTSTRIDTATKFNIDMCKPGRIDVKYVKMPNIQGVWPSSWLYFTDTAFHGGWAAGGEIDNGEMIGGHHPGLGTLLNEGLYFSNVWSGGQWPYASLLPTNVFLDPNVGHTFSLAWDHEGITMLDDNVVVSVINAHEFLSRGASTSGGYLSDNLVDGLPLLNRQLGNETYFMNFNDPETVQNGFPPLTWLPLYFPDIANELAALDAVLFAGNYSEPDRYFFHPNVEIARYQHPAPFDHNGFYLILQMNIGGNPYGQANADVYYYLQSLTPLINQSFPAGFKGVVSESQLANAIGQDKVDELNALMANDNLLPPENTELKTVIGSVKYYIAPGLTKICHKYDSTNRKTLEVDANAVKSHLAHGDYLGECRDQYVIGKE